MINLTQDLAQEKNLQEQPQKEKEIQDKNSLPDGIEEINGKLIDRKSGGEYLRMGEKALKAAIANMKHDSKIDKWKPVPYDPKLAKYYESINKEDKEEWNYEKARIKFHLVWANTLGRLPIVMQEDKWIVQDFVKWLIKDERSSFDLSKGVLFCGTQGCGKSQLMMAGAEFCRKTKIRKYGFKRVGDIFLEVSMSGCVKSIDPYLRGNWCFDDIGQMNEDVVVYSKLNIVETLINARISKPFLTLGTTNLLADEIRGKYGDIVASRFNQMFNIVQFSSLQDFRKL